MPNDFSSHLNMEEYAQLPNWAKSQARDPKVTRALVSTSTRRSELLRAALKPRNLVHCYAKPGYGLEPWLTRFLATLPAEYAAVDLTKSLLQHRLKSDQALFDFIRKVAKPAAPAEHSSDFCSTPHKVFLIRLDRLTESHAQKVINALGYWATSHTLILSSSTTPAVWLAETRFTYHCIHLGETQLVYSIEDYEKLTTRWPVKPSPEVIASIISLFDGWPEPCLRSLCELSDEHEPSATLPTMPATTDFSSSFSTQTKPDEGYLQDQWLAGHQWLATFIYSLPLDLLQILLTAHALPILTPEGLDLCGAHGATTQDEFPDMDSLDTRRRNRSRILSTLCEHMVLEQFTHPKLHFRWHSRSLQTVLAHIAKESRQLSALGLTPPKDLQGLTLDLCKLYMSLDYIQEIIILARNSVDPAGLIYLMQHQPGRVIDYLRGTANSNLKQYFCQQQNTVESILFRSNEQALSLANYLKTQFYWTKSEGFTSDSSRLSQISGQDTALEQEPSEQDNLFQSATASVFKLIERYETSRNALASGQLADGLSKLEHVFINAVDERSFSVAAPCMALIGLTDFFCINKKHLRRIMQSLDHVESLVDPETNLSLVDWTDTCISPLQLLSSHSQSIAKRLTVRSSLDLAGRIPEEAFMFQLWINCLANVFRGQTTDAQQQISNALTRVTTHFHQLQDIMKQQNTVPNQQWRMQQTTPANLLRPWLVSLLFIKTLNDIQIGGRPSAREAQNLLKTAEQHLKIIDSSSGQKDIWYSMARIVTLFLRSLQSDNADIVYRLEREVAEAQALGFRLLWVYGSLFLSVALWNSEQEDEALEHFYKTIEFAEANALQDVLTPLTDILHPQIRRAKQKGKAILLISRALEKIDVKNHLKNNRLEQLSKRELEILTFINQGMSNEDIADHLCRAKGTIKLHVHNIYKKLEIRNRVEAIQIFNQHMKSET